MHSPKPHAFPSFNSIMREHFKKKAERDLIKEFNRFQDAHRISIPEFCQLNKLDLGNFRKLLRKYGINAPEKDRSYEEIFRIVSAYYGAKLFYRKFICKKYDLSPHLIYDWKKNFLIHKNKDGSVKLILLNKDWSIYQKHLQKQKQLQSAADSDDSQDDIL